MKSINCPDCDTKLLYVKGSLTCLVCGRAGKEIMTKQNRAKQNRRLMFWILIPNIILIFFYFGIRLKLYEMQSLIVQKLLITIGLSILGGIIFVSSCQKDTTKRNSKLLLVLSILIFIAALFFLIKFLYLFFSTEWRPVRLF